MKDGAPFINARDYFKRLGSPIVSLATAAGGPVAILRVSGKKLNFLEKIIGQLPSAGNFVYRNIADIDHALVLYFQAPASFTGEDVVEIQCHGLSSVVNKIKEEIVRLGSLSALPGEFSFRAVFNEKISLEEAESLQVAFATEGISAKSASSLLMVSKNSPTKKYIQEATDAVIRARGRVEAAIDFPESEIEQSGDIQGAGELLNTAAGKISKLLNAYENFSFTAGYPTLAILGEPNAGKSTLLNILAGGERALTSKMPGTTRDIVESTVSLSSGRKIKVLDTAGLRHLPLTSEEESLEKKGMSWALEAASMATLLCFVEKAGDNKPDKNKESEYFEKIKNSFKHKKSFEIHSHADKLNEKSKTDIGAFNFLDPNASDDILKYISERVETFFSQQQEQVPNEETIEAQVSKRQHGLLEIALVEIKEAEKCLQGHMPLELAAIHIKNTEEALKKALGKNAGEEYIGEIFSQFCLGK